MRAGRGASALVLVLANALACSAGDLDYTGKTCPCPEGYACDPVSDRCARAASASGGSCTPAIAASSFRVGWKTPNTIRWEWDPDPNGEDLLLQRYEIRIGRGFPGDADTSQPESRWTAPQNAELGKFYLPHTGSPTADSVRATVTDGLVSNTAYWGQLLVIDASGCAWASDVLGAVTEGDPTPGRELVLFHDDLGAGWMVSDDPQGAFAVTEDPAISFAGSAACITYDPGASHAGNLHVGGLDVDLGPIDSDLAKTAYWEMAIATEQPSYYSALYLSLDPEIFPGFEPYTLNESTDYRVVQIPLRALEKDGGEGMVQGDLANRLIGFNLSGDWAAGSRLRIDEVTIRW